jgi:hypothetical protein
MTMTMTRWVCRLRFCRTSREFKRAAWFMVGISESMAKGKHPLVVAYRYTYVDESSRGQGRLHWDPMWIPAEWAKSELGWVDGSSGYPN